MLVELNQEQAGNLIEFLKRVDLKGPEALPFVAICNVVTKDVSAEYVKRNPENATKNISDTKEDVAESKPKKATK